MDFNSTLTRLNWFKQYKLGKTYTEIEAIEAIQLYALQEEPIPEELLPLLVQACEFWSNKNRRLYSKQETTDKNFSLAWDVALLMKQGVTKEIKRRGATEKDAFDIVAERHCVSRDKVRKAYEGTVNSAAKEEVELLFGPGEFTENPEKDEL